jgi:hypothetical protein
MIEYFNITSGNWYFHLIIGIILFLLFKWLIGKFAVRKNLKIILTIISTLILTPIVFNIAIAMIFSVMFYEYHPESKFDTIKWSENSRERHEMRKDLIESGILIGKTKSEVIKILGKPENNINAHNDTVKSWDYYLGSEGHGMGWKFHYLSLSFKNNIVEKAQNNEFID